MQEPLQEPIVMYRTEVINVSIEPGSSLLCSGMRPAGP
jgi:hypothetical protein